MVKTIVVTGDLMADIHTLLNVYKLPQSEPAVSSADEVGTQSEPQTVRVSEGDLPSTSRPEGVTEPSPTKRMADELKTRFPKNPTPNSKQLAEIWMKVGGDWDLFEDLLLVAEEMSTTQKINSLGGFLLYQMQQADGDLASIRANGERIRENKATDTTSVVANAMKEAGEKIRKLPARTGPNLVGARNLQKMKIGGAENLERAEGSATATEA